MLNRALKIAPPPSRAGAPALRNTLDKQAGPWGCGGRGDSARY